MKEECLLVIVVVGGRGSGFSSRGRTGDDPGESSIDMFSVFQSRIVFRLRRARADLLCPARMRHTGRFGIRREWTRDVTHPPVASRYVKSDCCFCMILYASQVKEGFLSLAVRSVVVGVVESRGVCAFGAPEWRVDQVAYVGTTDKNGGEGA